MSPKSPARGNICSRFGAAATKKKQGKVAKKPKEIDSTEQAMQTYISTIWKAYDSDFNGVLDKKEARDFIKEMMFDKSLKDDLGNAIEFTEDGFN